MRIIFYVLTIFILVVSFEITSGETTKKEIKLSNKQIEFADSMANVPGFAKAEWENHYLLNITLESYFRDSFEKESAEKVASSFAILGYSYTEETICIKIVSYKNKVLAYKCVGHQTET